jgi:hypothetical protein
VDIAEAFRRHAKRSDNLPPILETLRLAAQDDRIRRAAATFDEASREPVEFDPGTSAFATIGGRSVFLASRFAAKLRREETFARHGEADSHDGELHRLDGGEFVPCGDEYLERRGTRELGGEWRPVHGWITSRWLIAAAPTLDEARAAHGVAA